MKLFLQNFFKKQKTEKIRGVFEKEKNSKNHKNSGFTLIELLVAMVIGSMVMIMLMQSYWVMMQTHFRIEASREMQREMRFGMNRLTDKIRANALDYDAYDSLGDCNSVTKESATKICLTGRDENGDIVSFVIEKSGEELTFQRTTSGIPPVTTVAQPLFSDRFKVVDAQFRSTPADNPFDYDLASQMQPKTTIFIELESRRDSSVKLSVQTTVSSRVYSNQ